MPTVFENYTACLELDDQRVELSLWDTSGKLKMIQKHTAENVQNSIIYLLCWIVEWNPR